MNTQTQTQPAQSFAPIKTESYGKFRAEIYKRENPTKYTGSPYSVKYVQETPKAKFFKEKTISHFVYPTIEAAEAAKKFVETQKFYTARRENEKSEKRQKNAEVKAVDFYKIGDVIVNSWGYEQTNINFFQVTGITNKTIKIKEIGQTTEKGSEGFMSCRVLPEKNSFILDGKTYRLIIKAEGILSNPESYYYMHKWNGTSKYKSWYA